MAGLKFNGTNTKDGVIKPLPVNNYIIEIKLVDKDYNLDFSYSKTTPPMPANIGGWAIFKTALNNYFVFNSEIKAGTNIEFNMAKKNTIKIEASLGEGTRFYLNDDFVSVKEFYTPLKSFYRLGYGYEERKWTGDIKYVRVYGGEGFQTISYLDIQ